MFDTRWIQWGFFLAGYAICSGANVAYFAFSLRDLKKAVERGRDAEPQSREARDARRALALQRHLENPNWTLAAILLTNVGFGVQLSQLSDGLFAGILAVLMPIISITIFGEFFAQATFLRYAGTICYVFSPFVWLLKYITIPISWPLGRAVDALYGKEALRRLNEQDLLSDLQLELTEFGDDPGDGDSTEHHEYLDPRELKTLMNVAQADDELARDVGEQLDPETVIALPFDNTRPEFPDDLAAFAGGILDQAAHPWFVITNDSSGLPHWMLDADGFVRDLFQAQARNETESFNPHDHVYRARVYRDAETRLGEVVSDFRVHEEHPEDDVIDIDVALIWTDSDRWIVTGGDVLGRLLRGVTERRHWRQVREQRRGERDKFTATRQDSDS